MTRILALNLNHRTRPKPISVPLIKAIVELLPDIVVLNEFVGGGDSSDLENKLACSGFSHLAVSECVEYAAGRWHNQIAIASRKKIENVSEPTYGPDEMCRTNTLIAQTFGILITGIRVPAYETAGDWYSYWDWLSDNLKGDLAVGDFNADPSRQKKWDRVLDKLVSAGDWSRKEIEGPWSYRGNNGATSRVDHVLARGNVRVVAAKYVDVPFVPQHTDHAALLVDFELGNESYMLTRDVE